MRVSGAYTARVAETSGNLAGLFAREFGAQVRVRGRRYQQSGRVEVVALNPGFFAAEVRGSGYNRYEVAIAANPEPLRKDEEQLIGAHCSCPHFARGEMCKHLFACLLELDAGGSDLGLDVHQPIRWVPEAWWETERARGKRRARGRAASRPAAAGHRPTRSRSDRSRGGVSRRKVAKGLRPEGLPIVGERLWRAPLYGRSLVAYSIARSGLTRGELSVRIESTHPGTGRVHPVRVDPVLIDESFAGQDVPVLEALAACHAASNEDSVYARGDFDSVTVPAGLMRAVLPLLLATGRCRLEGDSELGALEWQPTSQLSLRLHAMAADRAGRARVLPELYLEEGTIRPLSECQAVLDGEVVLLGRTLCPFGPRGAAGLLRRFVQEGPMELRPTQLADFMDRAARMPTIPLDIDRKLRWSIESAQAVPRLSVQRANGRTPKTRAWVDVRFRYGDVEYDADDPRAGHAERRPKRLVRRDLAAEGEHLAQLSELGFEALPNSEVSQASLQISHNRLLHALHQLSEAGWELEIEGARVRRPRASNLSLETGIDWFELEAEVDFEGERVGLPALLRALERDASAIQLGDGSLGLIPREWLERLEPLARMGRREGDALHFHPSQALLLNALVERATTDDLLEDFGDLPLWTVEPNQELQRLCRKLERGRAPRARKAPRGFRGELRPYQGEGLGWLHHLRDVGLGGCLADDMGLGKTIQVLSLLESLRRGTSVAERQTSLVVVPRSLVDNWTSEAERFTPRLRVHAYTGPERAQLLDRLAEYDVVVTTYGVLRRDIDKLAQTRFRYVILDEATAIKNSASQTWKAARRVQAEHRLAVTGTPVENHLGELWALFEFLNPGMLGPSVRGRQAFVEDDAWLSTVGRALEPFLLRRTKQQVLRQLPAKTEQTLYCTLEGAQGRQYQELLQHYRSKLLQRVHTKGMGRSRMHVLEALLRLRQAACHPGLIDRAQREGGAAKLDLLLPALEQAIEEDHKVLVFSQFTSFLSIVRDHLRKCDIEHEYLDGRTRKRAECVRRFQTDPDCRVFLISLKAGGHGLNLTAADYVFLLDPWWNPAVEAQAIDRAHRIGQERAVMAYRLVARNTIEEKILELQRSKRRLADAIVSNDKGLLRQLTPEDLEVLLS